MHETRENQFIEAFAAAPHRISSRTRTVGGSATAGLFLSLCWYWAIRTTDQDGWWTRTRAEWQHETGLSRREQETIRSRLRMRGILAEKRIGVPARLYFRLNLGKLAQLIEQSANPTARGAEGAIPGWRILSNNDGCIDRA